MGRTPKPWFDDEKQIYRVTIRKTRYNLGPDKAQADLKFHRLMGTTETEYVPTLSFSTLCQLFLDWCKAHRKPKTYTFYRDFLEPFVERIGESFLAAQVRAEDIEAAYLDTWGDTSKRGLCRSVGRVFRWAMAPQQKYIAVNPIAGLEMPTADTAIRFLDADERKRLLAGVKGSLKDAVVFMLETGCRPQELRAIESKHIVRDTISFERKDAKGKKKPRRIALTPKALAIVTRLAKVNQLGKLFRTPRGNRWTTENLGDSIRVQAESLKIKDVTAYSLRHTFATHALAKGIDVATLAALMGTSIRMIDLHYGHLTEMPDHLKAAAKRAVS